MPVPGASPRLPQAPPHREPSAGVQEGGDGAGQQTASVPVRGGPRHDPGTGHDRPAVRPGADGQNGVWCLSGPYAPVAH
eukprot:4364101-Alexandrium_andersonii.AAC.1